MCLHIDGFEQNTFLFFIVVLDSNQGCFCSFFVPVYLFSLLAKMASF